MGIEGILACSHAVVVVNVWYIPELRTAFEYHVSHNLRLWFAMVMGTAATAAGGMERHDRRWVELRRSLEPLNASGNGLFDIHRVVEPMHGHSQGIGDELGFQAIACPACVTGIGLHWTAPGMACVAIGYDGRWRAVLVGGLKGRTDDCRAVQS